MSDSEDGFIERWSRRKHIARGEPEKKPPGPKPGVMVTDAPISDAEPEDGLPEYPTDAPGPDMDETGEQGEADFSELEKVDLDALDFNSDYTPFMKPGVPEALRRRALRRLWQSHPILANVDGLNDYDEDFSDAALAVEVLKTAHRVGRGFLGADEVDGETEAGVEGAPPDAIASAETSPETDGDPDAADDQHDPCDASGDDDPDQPDLA